jgi:hypothetical protein
MSGIRERLKEVNEVESTDDRIAAALAKLPRRMQCKYVAADGTLCQRRRTGKSWCDTCRERVSADPKRRELLGPLPRILRLKKETLEKETS